METMRVGLQLPSFGWPGGPAGIRARLELSGGRACLGLGAAWYEREALGLGFAFPARDAVERLRGQAEEGIENVIINLPDAHQPGWLESMGRDVLPALEAVRP